MIVVLLTFAALAGTPEFSVVPRETGYRTMSATVPIGNSGVSTDQFATALLDCNAYPLTATYMGVQALVECKNLARLPDGSSIAYQRTGGNAVVSGRQWVIQLRVREKTDTVARVDWDLIQHTVTDGEVTGGPWASVVQAHPEAVFTPYNAGSWKLDRSAGTITYTVSSDPGGSLPSFMTTQGAVMAFPLELMKVRWGIVP